MNNKDLNDIYNFYKNCTEGFVTKDGYAAVPFKNQFIVVYSGEQLKLCRTKRSAMNFIKTHRQQPKSGTIFIQ